MTAPPSGAKTATPSRTVYISFGGHRVLTQVIDRGPNAPGREFNVTKALADEIGLHGTRSIRWSFAR